MTSILKKLKSWALGALVLTFLVAGTMSSCTTKDKVSNEAIEEGSGTEEHPEASESEEHPSDSTATSEEHPTDSEDGEEEHPDGN